MLKKISDKDYYSPADFIKSPKYDAHIHYHILDDLFVRKAKNANIHLLTINTNLDFFPLKTQFEIAQIHHQHYPQTFNFLSTFDATTFASKTFAEDALGFIKNCMEAGARGVKIWKNIGMFLKNEAGQYVMADDPVFDPIFAFLEKEKIPLLAHLGEPRSCWLPLEQITNLTTMRYFSKNPKFHMYLHPEVPSYDQQIIVRDRILERYPRLIFVGAHLGSVEWNLEELAKRLDQFPNFYVDLSGRLVDIYEQTIQDRNIVIDFFEAYQNRILYGSDRFVSQYNSRRWMGFFCNCFPQAYVYLFFIKYSHEIKQHWLFLSTDQVIKTGKINNNPESHIKGLRLSKEIVDRIFYKNTRCVYFGQ